MLAKIYSHFVSVKIAFMRIIVCDIIGQIQQSNRQVFHSR